MGEVGFRLWPVDLDLTTEYRLDLPNTLPNTLQRSDLLILVTLVLEMKRPCYDGLIWIRTMGLLCVSRQTLISTEEAV